MGINISVVFTTDAYTATVTETGESPDIETGTWTRMSSTTVVLSPSDDIPMTLTKEGAYYTCYPESDYKMIFRKV